MEKDINFAFGGWARLNPNTLMRYIGDNENWDQIITARVWANLPVENQQFYILEDVVAALRDASAIDYSDLSVWSL